ncbi:hypothetical protein B484DRAFT_364998 [Ochromonadaceae sp. CCMP2298]|nr:hypothetical protein B484DRAFT_364998 [Ochromonadaceae sp. CCMP2298]
MLRVLGSFGVRRGVARGSLRAAWGARREQTLSSLSRVVCSSSRAGSFYLRALALIGGGAITFSTTECEAESMAESVAVPRVVSVTSTVAVLRQKLQQCWDLLKALLRCGMLWLYFLPPIAALPMLALQQEAWSRWWWVLLRQSICLSGPCFIKFGQWAGMRTDLFRPSICAELAQLQAGAQEHSLGHTRATLLRVLGPHWEEVLSLEGVVGSGCVAQVYRGRLRKGALREVAVKVLHPNMRQSMERDLRLMGVAAAAAEAVGQALLSPTPPLVCVDLSQSVREFSRFMRSQLDLRDEARSLQHLGGNFSSHKWRTRVVVPRPGCEQLLPHCEVLVESFHEGEPMTQVLANITDARSPHKHASIAALGLDVILKMLFEDNFIHADMHAGNLFVQRAASRPVLVLLDAGLTIELHPQDRKNFIALFKAVVENDGREAARLMMASAPSGGGDGDGGVVRAEEFEYEMAALVDEVHKQGLSLGAVSVGQLLAQVLGLCYRHHVQLESRFVSVVVAIMLAEGMGRRLDPEVDIIKRAAPHIRSAAVELLLRRPA